MQSPKHNLARAAYSVDQLSQILPFGKTQLYKYVKQQQLRKTKCGKKTLFLAADVEEFLDKITAGKVT